jgi:arylsulfatase A-like enzyme
MKNLLPLSIAPFVLSGFAVSSCANSSTTERPDKPNILIILTDDQGYGDVSFHNIHAPEISTPGMDQIAKKGLIFTNGYVTAYNCAPSRYALLTGRYQQRTGFYQARDSREGMSLDEITLADFLKTKGYKTGVLGKWHVGLDEPYRPLNRGFDYFYGFLGHGGHDYFDLNCYEDNKHNCIYRNNTIVEDEGYLTDILGKEAEQFIKKNAAENNPFFLHLAFNAVHSPLQAPEEDIQRFDHENPDRNIYLAMLYRMDVAIDNIIKTLKDNGVYENTIIFFLTDNGGARAVSADNRPLRGYKQSVYEGGVRVPFAISWPNRFKPGVIDEPVMSFDFLPTVCDILGIDLPTDRVYDGKSLIPLIEGRQDGPLHDYMFWDGDRGPHWAVRHGDWKLVLPNRGRIENVELYNLAQDISESNNLARQYPEMTQHLVAKYQEWRSEMGAPMRPADDSIDDE